MKENGKTVRCPECGSKKVEAVMPFDYWKMCMNDKCEYHMKHPKKMRYVFQTGVHN